MKIYFVRHGHPNYKNDCLTELGHRQAEAAAERLKNVGIESVFSSTKGRAFETAEHTAKKLGLEVVPCDFMREISWASVDGEPILSDGHPWYVADILASEGKTLTSHDWQNVYPYCKSRAVACVDTVTKGLDSWLAELGYVREGEYYRVTCENTDKVVAMFSHGGSSAAALAHLFNIPFAQLVGFLRIGFTGITVVDFRGKTGELIYPKLTSSDMLHVESLENVENVYGN